MKMIVAIVKPHTAGKVADALLDIDILGITSYDVHGFGKEHKEAIEVYRGSQYHIKQKPMVLLMTAVTDDMVDQVKATIRQHANTGEISSGKIFVLDLEQVMRIRTGEEGIDGLT